MCFKEQEKQMLKKLEKNGLKRSVRHVIYTEPYPRVDTGKEIVRAKGRTDVRIYDKKTREEVAHASAVCSVKDQFTKALGRTIATGRALKTIYL